MQVAAFLLISYKSFYANSYSIISDVRSFAKTPSLSRFSGGLVSEFSVVIVTGSTASSGGRAVPNKCCLCARNLSEDACGLCDTCAHVSKTVHTHPQIVARILKEELGYCVIPLRPRTYAAAPSVGD